MKERPILFSGEMVRAILNGRKTQTRRVIKPQPPEWVEYVSWEEYNRRWMYHGYEGGMITGAATTVLGKELKCPYGKSGDRLWVREIWQTTADHDDLRPRDCCAGSAIRYRADELMQFPGPDVKPQVWGKWRRPIFMPSLFSRITLEIKDVRVERVQNISDGESLAEGVKICGGMGGGLIEPKERFKELWNSIYQKRGFGWDSNPWVWIVEFVKL